MLVIFFERRFPCLRWAWVCLRPGHSDWIWSRDDRVVNGRHDNPRTSCTVVERTTESSVMTIDVQIWHLCSLYSEAMRMAKSDEIFADPASLARCETMTWYLLTIDRNEVTRGLAKNSPRYSFWKAWTHGLLSVSKHTCWLDWIINGL
jgi:hypothetical protein